MTGTSSPQLYERLFVEDAAGRKTVDVRRRGFVGDLHLELALTGIGVSVLCPGPVATYIVARTAKVQPAERDPPSEEQRELVLALATPILHAGVSPDTVGEMVLDAVLGNHLYLHTDRIMANAIEARAKALLDAMPEA